MDVELEDLRRQFAAVKEEAAELVGGLDEARFNWRPEPGRWSIAENLSHLNITGDQYLPAMERAAERARSEGRLIRGPFRLGWFSSWLIRSMEPPVRRKFRAPRSFQPVHGQPVTAVMPTFLHLQDQFMRALESASGLDLARVKVISPINRLLRIPLGACFALMAAHERRHLWQSRRVRVALP